MRLLPGDLVSFNNPLANVQLVEVRQKRRIHKDAMFNTGKEASRIEELFREQRAVSCTALYLVLAASESKAFLMKCDTGKYLVALDPAKDLDVHNR